MAGTPAPKDLYLTLLQRDCAIAKETTWTNTDGGTKTLTNAAPRRFGPIGGPWPLLRVYVSSVRYEYSQKFVDHFVVVTFEVFAGGVASGSAGEYEDDLNALYVALPYEFERRPLLNHPTTGLELDYLMPDDFTKFAESPVGTAGFEVDDGNGVVTRYFGTEFLQSVHLRVPRARLS